MALRLGFRPLEWEFYQPVDLYALAEAAEFRREQETYMMARAIGLAFGGGKEE